MPSLSSYTVNNPVNLVDPDGRIHIVAETKEDYDALVQIVRALYNAIRTLKENSPKLRYFYALSGFKTKSELLGFLRVNGKGPVLTARRLIYGNENRGRGLDDGSGGPGVQGKFTGSEENQVKIVIDQGIVDAVKDAIKSQNIGHAYGSFEGVPPNSGQPVFLAPNVDQTMTATLGYAGRVLHHEITHWGAWYNLNMTGANDNVNVPIPPTGINLPLERGSLWEVLSFGNLGSPFNPASNPSWAIARSYTHIQYTVTNGRATMGSTIAMNTVNRILLGRALQWSLQVIR